MSDPELPDALRGELRTAWHALLDHVQPLRPGLHGYCRRLTGDVWDAEDLVQDTLLRAFGSLARIHDPIRKPRAYLLRTATNLWIDQIRRRDREKEVLSQTAVDAEALRSAAEEYGGEMHDAGRRLLQRLAPRERAAVLLKDVFDLDLEESAEVLETTVGAVKAALHRGRERLREIDVEPDSRRAVPSVALVDRFVELYNASDKEGLVALVLEHATVDNLGAGLHWTPEGHRSPRSWFSGALDGHPDWPAWFQFEAQRAERATFDGEPIVLHFHTRRGREKLDAVTRLEEEDGRVARLRCYGFCPETMREVASALGREVSTGLYHGLDPA